MLQVTHDRNDLKMEEQNIICGALELHKKTVGEVMTKLDDVYMLSIDRNLDFDTINEIMQQGEWLGDGGSEGEARRDFLNFHVSDSYVLTGKKHELKTICLKRICREHLSIRYCFP